MTWIGMLASLAALLVTAPYWTSAALKAVYFQAAVDEVRDLGIEPAKPVALMTIVIQGASSALVIVNIQPLFGVFALSAFTLAASIFGHAFWRMSAGQRLHGMAGFFANVGLIGGLMSVALLLTAL